MHKQNPGAPALHRDLKCSNIALHPSSSTAGWPSTAVRAGRGQQQQAGSPLWAGATNNCGVVCRVCPPMPFTSPLDKTPFPVRVMYLHCDVDTMGVYKQASEEVAQSQALL